MEFAIECSSHGFGCFPVRSICLMIKPEKIAPINIPNPNKSDNTAVIKAIIIAAENKLVFDMDFSKKPSMCGKIKNLSKNSTTIKTAMFNNLVEIPK